GGRFSRFVMTSMSVCGSRDMVGLFSYVLGDCDVFHDCGVTAERHTRSYVPLLVFLIMFSISIMVWCLANSVV
ncbi:MAG: hypothetical protein ACTSW7_04525, partial [Candidatus Thorarchaeota archaeon]